MNHEKEEQRLQNGVLKKKQEPNEKNIEEERKMTQKGSEKLTEISDVNNAMERSRNIQQHVQDTLIHKRLFEQSCLKMVNHLYEVGRNEDALELARRCIVHDNSKLNDEEIECFIQLPMQKTGENSFLSDEQKKILETHWKNNRHHPEHFKNHHEMNEIDILEMCCDWHARHIQYCTETTLIEYVKDVQKKRFGFDHEMLEKIVGYCEILEREE